MVNPRSQIHMATQWWCRSWPEKSEFGCDQVQSDQGGWWLGSAARWAEPHSCPTAEERGQSRQRKQLGCYYLCPHFTVEKMKFRWLGNLANFIQVVMELEFKPGSRFRILSLFKCIISLWHYKYIWSLFEPLFFCSKNYFIQSDRSEVMALKGETQKRIIRVKSWQQA